jgi:hypothetical protein
MKCTMYNVWIIMIDTNQDEFRPRNFNWNFLMLYFAEIRLVRSHFGGEICQIITPNCQLRQIYADLYSIGVRFSKQILSLLNHTTSEFFWSSNKCTSFPIKSNYQWSQQGSEVVQGLRTGLGSMAEDSVQ